MSDDNDLTDVLNQAGLAAGNDSALEGRLYELVREHLRTLARGLVRKHDGDPTLEPTMLVDEAFMRLVRTPREWENRESFFRIAHGTMKRILRDHHRRDRPDTFDEDNVVILDEASADPACEAESAELLPVMADVLRTFIERGDTELVELFLMSFLHHTHRVAGMSPEDSIRAFTGKPRPMREVAEAAGMSIPTVWRKLGKAMEELRCGLVARGYGK